MTKLAISPPINLSTEILISVFAVQAFILIMLSLYYLYQKEDMKTLKLMLLYYPLTMFVFLISKFYILAFMLTFFFSIALWEYKKDGILRKLIDSLR